MTRRRTRRRDTRTPAAVITSGLVMVALLGTLSLLALRSTNGLPYKSYKTVYVAVPEPGNLQTHSEVRTGGVRVGQVVGVRRGDGGARIELKLDADEADFPVDTSALVRGAGLLGQRFVELRPGSSRRIVAEGGVITGPRDALTNGVPDFLKAFDARTRHGITSAVDGLGRGLQGRGEGLNRALRAGPPNGEAFPLVARAIRERPGAAERLLSALAGASATLDDASDELAAAMTPTADGLATVNARRDELGRALSELPPLMAAARPGLSEGRVLLRSANTLATAAADVLPRAPGALRATAALLRESPRPLERARRLVDAAGRTVPQALRLTRAASPVFDPLQRTLRDLDPVVAQLGKHACDIDNFAENWRSALGYGIPGTGQDTPLPNGAIGPLNFFRVTVLAGKESVQRFSLPPNAAPDPYSAPCKYSPGGVYTEPNLNGGR